MKTITLFFMLLVTFLNCFSQDKIVRNTGEGFECKITKEDSTKIYFTFIKNGKEIETLIDKSEVKEVIYDKLTFSEPIFYKKESDKYVYFQNGNKLQKEDLSRILESNANAYKIYSNAHETYVFSNFLAFVGGGLIGWPIGTSVAGGEPNWTLAIIGGGLVLVAIPISIGSKDKINKAIDTYNEGIKSSSLKQELKLGIINNGFGLQLTF